MGRARQLINDDTMIDSSRIVTLVHCPLVILNVNSPGISYVVVEHVSVSDDCQGDGNLLDIRVVLFLFRVLFIWLSLLHSLELGFALPLGIIAELLAHFLRMARQLLNLGEENAGLPLLDVLAELLQDLPDSFILVGFDFEIDIAMAILCLAESDLVEKFCISERLLVASNNLRNKVFGHLSRSLSAHFLFSLPIFLCFTLKLLSVI